MSSNLFFDNKKYISAKEAALLTSYSNDYIGQLCRAGKLDCKQVGRVWYVSEESISNYKNSPVVFDFSKNFKNVSTPVVVQSVQNKSDFKNKVANALERISRKVLLYDFSFFKKTAYVTAVLILIFGFVSVARSLFVFTDNIKSVASSIPQILSNNLIAISGSISSAPFDIYDNVGDVLDTYTNDLSEKYISFGINILNINNNLFNQIKEITKNPPAYILKIAKGFATGEKFAVDKSFILASDTISDIHVKIFTFVSDSFGGVPYATTFTKDSTKKLTGAVAFSIQQEVLSPVDRAGIATYSAINNFFSTKIYSPIANLFNKKAIVIASTPTKVSPKTPLVLARATTANTTTTRVVERVVTEKTIFTGITSEELDLRLQDLNNRIISKFSQLSFGNGGDITNVYQQIANSQRIDNLTNTVINTPTLNNPRIIGGDISGTSISATTLSSNIFSTNSLSSASSTFSGLATFNNNATFAGNVGIGTTSPEYALDIVGNIRASGGIVTGGQTIGGDFSVSGTTTLTNLLVTGTTTLQSATSTSFFASLFHATTGLIDTFNSTIASIVGLNVTNGTTTNATTTNSFITSLIATNATSTNLFATNFTNTNSIITNATSTNFFTTIASSTNLFTTLGTLGTAVIGNLTVTGATNYTGIGTTTFSGDILVPGISAWKYLTANFIQATSTTATSTISTGGFAVGGSHFVVQQNSGNIGIGNTNPLYNMDITGTVRATGHSYFDSNIFLGNATTSDITYFNSRIGSSLIPTIDNLLDLGDSTNWLRFRTGYFGTSLGIAGTATSTGTQLTSFGAYLIDSGSTLSINTGNNQAVNFGIGKITIPYASTTALTVSATNGLSLGSLTGPLQAVGGSVSASSTLSVFYGGTGANSYSSNSLIFYNGSTFTSTSTHPLYVGSIIATSSSLISNLPQLTSQYSTSTIYSSFFTASTTNLIIGGSSFNNLLGSGLINSGGALTVQASVSNLTNYDWTFANNYGSINLTPTTTAVIWAKGGINASSTSNFVYASSTALTIFGNSYLNTLNLSGTANNSLLSTNVSGDVVATSTPTFGNFNATSTTLASTIGAGGLNISGALTANSFNGNTITTGTGTLTLGAGKTLTLSDSTTLNTNAITLAGGEVITFSPTNTLSLLTTAGTSVTLPTSGTLYGTKTDSITSLQLLTSLSDETGTGLAVFATSPTFTTSISTPSITLSGQAINSILSTNSAGVIVATSTPTFGNFNATSTVATSTISTGGLTVGTNQFIIQQNSGNIGMGTLTPLNKLDVNGSMALGTYAGVNTAPTGTSLIISGNVGIGTTTPNFKLDVAGSGYISSNLFVGGTVTATSTLNVTGLTTLGNATSSSLTVTGGTYLATTNGNVGIGTTLPGASLDIKPAVNVNPFNIASSSGSNIFTMTPDGRIYQTADVNSTAGLKVGYQLNTNLYSGAGQQWGGLITTSHTVAGQTQLGQTNGILTALYHSAGFTMPYWAGIETGAAFLDGAGSNVSEIYGVMAAYPTMTNGAIAGTVAPLYIAYDNNPGSISNAYALESLSQHPSWFYGPVAVNAKLGINIGTSTPASQLDIDTPSGGGSITLRSTSLTSRNYSIGMSASPAGGLDFRDNTANASRLFIKSDGSVGIGTTTPNFKLDVAGSGYISSNLFVGGTVTATSTLNVTGLTTLGNATSSSLTVTGGTYLATTNGNVGIGTTSPTANLHINNPSTDKSTTPFLISLGGVNPWMHVNGYGLGMVGDGNANIPYIAVENNVSQDIGLKMSVTANASNYAELAAFSNTTQAPDLHLTAAGNIQILPGASKVAGVYSTTNPIWLIDTAAPSTNNPTLGFGYSGTKYAQIYRQTSTGNMYIDTQGSSYNVIIPNGNVGIGTTSPGQKLVVIGNPTFKDSTSVNGIQFVTGTGAAQQIYSDYYGAGSEQSLILGTFTNRANQLVLATNGNVGIGTTSPAYKLDVQDLTSGNGQIRVGGLSNGYDAINFSHGGVNKSQITSNISGTGYEMGFWVNNTNTQAMTILSTGNVGIGTTTPLTKLDVYSATAAIHGFSGGAASGMWTMGYDVTNNRFAFASSSNITTNVRMVINNLGNVGIGTTSPVGKLAVLGESVFAGGASVGLSYAGTAAPANGLIIQGNVGIGTTTPNFKLDVAGSGYISSNLFVGGTVTATSTLNVTGLTTLGNATSSSLTVTGGTYLATTQGNVGIGTTTPNFKLDVAGSGYISSNLFVGGTVTATSTLNVTGLTTLGNATSSSLTVTGGTYLATTQGNVGIGTTSPAYLLDIQGSVAQVQAKSSGVNYATFQVANNGGTVYFGKESNVGNNLFTGALPYAGVVSVNSAYPLQLATNGTARVTIDSTGNVGIGTTTPNFKLDVAGSGYISSNLFVGGTVTATSTLNVTGLTTLGNATSSSLTVTGGTYLATTNGNVGIGTTGPAATLDVNGNSIFRNSMQLNNGTNVSGYFGTASSFITGGASTDIGMRSSANIFLSVNNSSTPSVTINTSGNVGIGTTTPNFKLDVAGSGYISSNLFVGGTVTATSTLNVTGLTTLGNATSSSLTVTGGTYLATTNGNVGIGTTSPQQNLSIYAAGATASTIQLANGTTGSAAANGTVFQLGSDGNAYLWNFYNGSLGFATNNQQRVTIKNDGNVGIGTTGPETLLHLVSAAPVMTFEDNVAPTLGKATFGEINSYFGFSGNRNYATGAIFDTGKTTGGFDVYTGDSDSHVQIYTTPTNNTQPVERMRIDKNGNVGIGTTSPASLLHLYTSSGNTALLLDGTATGNPYISFRQANTERSYIQFTENGSSDYLNIVSGTGQLVVSNSGNVGIGTTSPAYKLDVWGNLNVATSSTPALFVNTATTQVGIGKIPGAGLALDVNGWINGTVISGSNANFSSLYTSSNNQTLILQGRSYTAAGMDAIDIIPTASTTSGTFVGLAIKPTYTQSGASAGTDLLINRTETTVGSGAQLLFDAQVNGTSKFVINNQGNVGIGTTSPTGKLTVAATDTSAITDILVNPGAKTSGNYLDLQTNGASKFLVNYQGSVTMSGGLNSTGIGRTSSLSNISFAETWTQTGTGQQTNMFQILPTYNQPSATSVKNTDLLINRTETSLGTTPGNQFLIDAQVNGTSKFVINNTGNVGIGTTSPTSKLSIKGSGTGTGKTFAISNSSDVEKVTVLDNGNFGLATTSPWRTLSVTGTVGFDGLTASISGDSAVCLSANKEITVNSGVTSCIVSSIRYKHDVATSSIKALDLVNAMRPVIYKYNGQEGEHLGFIAEEVDLLEPRLVARDNEGNIRSVRYEEFTSVLAKAVQELDLKMTDIDGRLSHLEALMAMASSTGTGVSGDSNGGGLTFSSILTQFESLGARFIGGIVFVKNLVVESLTVGSKEKPTGITLYDEATGDPYCLKVRNGAAVSLAGTCDSLMATTTQSSFGTVSTSSPSVISGVDTSAPVVSLIGSNPAELIMGSGSSYSDMGVTVTDTNADGSVNNNLGYKMFLDGVEVQSISIDTTATSTHTVLYSATDGAGNVGEATRVINVILQP